MSTRGARPDYEDVVEAIDQAQSAAGNRIRVQRLGKSVQGRDIPCAICTDPAVANDDKQHVMIVAGQHGAEESGRAIALSVLEFLASGRDEAPDILRKQVVAIVPSGSPDGAQLDDNRNAAGEDVAHTYAFDAPAATPEGRALERFALEFVPDIFIDMHGRAGGGMKELAWLSPAWGFSSDRYFLTEMSSAMARAGEEAGFPQAELDPPSRLDITKMQSGLLGEKLAAECKTLSFGLETIEKYYREVDWRTTGLARMRRLLRFGMEDAFGLGEPGYPVSLISGTRMYAIKAHGTTAGERRANRVEMLGFLRRHFCIAERDADGVDRCARVKVFSKTCDGQNPHRFALLLRIKKPCRVKGVRWKGQPLSVDNRHGYRLWEDNASVLVQANIAEPFGGPERFLEVHYDSPLFD
jgi:hypothetical protein